jgi:hypothetical protein
VYEIKVAKKEMYDQILAGIKDRLAEYVENLPEMMTVDEAEKRVQGWREKEGQNLIEHTLRRYGANQKLEEEGIRCECGQSMNYQGKRPKTLQTLVGTVTVERGYWYCRQCHQGVAPLDDQMGIAQMQTSLGVQREAGWYVSKLTMEETAEALNRAYSLNISARQGETLIIPVGQMLEQEEKDRLEQVWRQEMEEVSVESGRRWYVEMDGVFTQIRRGEVPLTKIEEYVTIWIQEIQDSTPLVKKMYHLLQSGHREKAIELMPKERTYPINEHLARRLGILF